MSLRVRAMERYIGKLTPYTLLGLIQGAAVLAGAGVILAFANLSLGFLFSVVARAQMPAMQMTYFFFLPSSLLSGFMFRFSAMPPWAQAIGETLPLTHFLRIVRGVALRGADAGYVAGELWPILAFTLIAGGTAGLACRVALRAGPA